LEVEMRARSIPCVLSLTALLVSALLTGCSSDDGGTTTVDVGLKEFTVTPDPVEVDAGEVEFTADNIGSETHEMVVVRAANAEDLPTDADGAVDEEQIPKADQIGEVEDVPAGKSKSVSFDLKAGKYVIFCNIVEEESDGRMVSHFHEGMHETFTVK
jgi:hypothetical protein